MSLLPGDVCVTNERGLKGEEAVKDLTDDEVEGLDDWVQKYQEKYVVVGNLLWGHTLTGATKLEERKQAEEAQKAKEAQNSTSIGLPGCPTTVYPDVWRALGFTMLGST